MLLTLQCQPNKMVRHIQAICWLFPMNCLSMSQCPPPSLQGGPEHFSMLEKRGDFHCLNFQSGGSKKGGVDFFLGRRAEDFLIVIFNADEISHKKSNVNYSSNHNHNVPHLLTIFKCLQLINQEHFINIKHSTVLNLQIKIV